MPHPIAYISKTEWNKWLEIFKETFALISLSERHLSEEETAQTISNLVNLVESEKTTIFERAAHGISNYCGLYYVVPKEMLLDEFKHIYFLGTAVAETLRHNGEKEWATTQLLAVQALLDFRLMQPFKAHRPDLTHRMKKTIELDKMTESFGRYGWYVVYKCLFNAARESQSDTLPAGVLQSP